MDDNASPDMARWRYQPLRKKRGRRSASEGPRADADNDAAGRLVQVNRNLLPRLQPAPAPASATTPAAVLTLTPSMSATLPPTPARPHGPAPTPSSQQLLPRTIDNPDVQQVGAPAPSPPGPLGSAHSLRSAMEAARYNPRLQDAVGAALGPLSVTARNPLHTRRELGPEDFGGGGRQFNGRGDARAAPGQHAPAPRLSDVFASVQFDQIPDEQALRDRYRLFFVPAMGYVDSLVSRCLSAMSKAFLPVPLAAELRVALHQPSSCRNPGLVLLANHVLHRLAEAEEWSSGAMARHMQHLRSSAIRAFSWNVRTALEDAFLLLRASEAALQAFLLLTVRGEANFGLPEANSMLLSQACLQAKAIALHYPPGRQRQGDEAEVEANWQRRLCSFWSLFVVDKNASLAFGRPENLEAAHYPQVPLPDSRHLAQYRAGARVLGSAALAPGLGEGDDGPNSFGHRFYIKNIELAKMSSRYLSLRVRGTPEEARKFRLDLERWYSDTMKDLEHAFLTERPRRQVMELSEMELGLRVMTFQYLHLKVLVTQHLDADEDDCLAASREALSLALSLMTELSSLTSLSLPGSGATYGGTIWQLLYYPFAPFFVVFRGVLGDPVSRRCDDDLELLGSIPAYYALAAQTVAPLWSKAANKLKTTMKALWRLAEFLAGRHPPHLLSVAQQRAVNEVLAWYAAVSREAEGGENEGEGEDVAGEAMPFGRTFDWFLWEAREVPVVPARW